MNDVIVEINETSVTKRSTTKLGYARVSREHASLQALQESAHVPRLLSSSTHNSSLSLTLELIHGENAEQWLQLDPEWHGTPVDWPTAQKRLGQYVPAKMDLLNRGAQYRDLNLEHLIFQNDKAVLVDHEATIINETGSDDKWIQNDTRDTWETMALEEFNGHGVLTKRTATYRSAIIAHLALSGELPFERLSSRSDTHKWRKQHPPKVSSQFTKATRHVFAAALARKPTHRHKDPASFLSALEVTLP